jgi:hypothetical protein
MLSKAVKIRIASNKYFKRVPLWQRQMYEYFRSQIAMAQRQYDTAKHYDEPEGSSFRALHLARRNTLEEQSRTWTRADWREHQEQQRLLMKQIRQANCQTFGRLGKPTPEQLMDFEGDEINNLGLHAKKQGE